MTSFLSLLAGLLATMGGPVTGLSIQPAPERTEVVISMEGQAEYRDFTMEGPNRLVLDLLDSHHALPRDNFLDIRRGGIRSIRTSQYSADIVRVVIELDRVVGYQILPGDGELRLVLENSGESFEPWSTGLPAAELQPAREVAGSNAVLPIQVEAQRISLSFQSTPIAEVLFTFAEFADRSIVPGADVEASISAEIRDQPWDVALQVILESQGLVAREMESGIIRVDNLVNLNERETLEQPSTRAFQVNYATAAELQTAVQALLTRERGQVSSSPSTNTLIVTDVKRVLDQVEALVEELDRETPQVGISAKIVFINRTDLREFGVTYDLKDSEGNQLNVLTPGAIDLDGDGVIDPATEQVEIGTDVVALGGSSFAALGNARSRVPNPNLTLLTSLIIGRHTLINFIEALESMNLSDIQAHPSVTVMDNQEARILVGEETPIRVLDAQAGGGQQGIPTAQVEIRETGIILQATPHVTGDGKILLQLHAERSAAIPAESDAGFVFQTQEADSRVLVEDGETVVIAGLTVTETNEVRAGIPLLMDVPVLGRLFRVTREQTVQRDLMILVTPTIVRGGWN
ncbi:MAG: AMIN domain-containing protein [Longimicrobiales bacterium]